MKSDNEVGPESSTGNLDCLPPTASQLNAENEPEFNNEQLSWIIRYTIKELAAKLEVAETIFDAIADTAKQSFQETGEPNAPMFSKANVNKIIHHTTLKCHEMLAQMSQPSSEQTGDEKELAACSNDPQVTETPMVTDNVHKCPRCFRTFTRAAMLKVHLNNHE